MHKLVLFVLIFFGSIAFVACDWAFFADEIQEIVEDDIEEIIERHKKIQEERNSPKISNMKIVPLQN